MMEATKNAVFAHWLAEYGTHLEQLAAARLSGDSEDEQRSERVREPESCTEQER